MRMHRVKYLALTFVPVVVLMVILLGSVFSEATIVFASAEPPTIDFRDSNTLHPQRNNGPFPELPAGNYRYEEQSQRFLDPVGAGAPSEITLSAVGSRSSNDSLSMIKYRAILTAESTLNKDDPTVWMADFSTTSPGTLVSHDGGETMLDKVSLSGQTIIANTSSSKNIYIGYYLTTSDKVWKTSDGGYSFQNLSSFPTLPSGAHGTDIFVDPNDPDRVWVVVERQDTNGGCSDAYARVYFSEDGGSSWTQGGNLNQPDHCLRNAYRGAISPVNGDLLLVGGSGQASPGKYDGVIYRSLDGGYTWTQVYSPTDHGYSFITSIVTPIQGESAGTVWYAGILARVDNPKRGIVKSTNSGASWVYKPITQLSDEKLVYDVAVDALDANLVLAFVDDETAEEDEDGIYRSTDGGTNWTKTFTTTTDLSNWDIEVDPDATGVFWMVGSNVGDSAGEGLYRSDDGGVTWQRIYSGNVLGRTFSKPPGFTVYWPQTALAISPHFPGLLDRMLWSAAPECPTCSSQSAVGWAGGPINTNNGSLSYQERDLSVPIKGGELAFRRSYASGSTDFYATTMGYGWTHNYDMQLHFDNTALTNTVEFQAAGGSRLPFYCSSSGCTASDVTFDPYPGVTASLSRITATNPITTHYVISGFNQMAYTFNHLGFLLEQADPSGNQITFTYDINDQLSRAAQGSRYLDYTYDGNGRLSEVEDHTGRSVALTYNNGDLVNTTLVGVNNSLVLTNTYEYSGTTHLLTKATDPSGTVVEETTYVHDGDDYRAYEQQDGLGNTMAEIDYSQDDEHGVTQNGVVMTHTYDYRGTLVDSTYACSAGTSGCGEGTDKTYDYNFKASEVVDANGNSTDLEWDAGGSNLEGVTDALGHESSLTYDSLNNLTQVTNARNQSTDYGYGNTNLPTFRTLMTNTLGNATVYTPTLAATDGISGLLKSQRDPNGLLTTYDYNEYGQVTEAVRAAGTTDALTTTYGYDSLGRLITTTQTSTAESHTSLNIYDDADRLIASIANWTGSNPANWLQNCPITGGSRDSNVCTRYGYDGAGRTISTTNPLGLTNLTFYDDAGRVVTHVVNYDGSTATSQLCTSFADPDPEYNICSLTGYDSYGRVLTSTDSLGIETVTQYDALGRVSRMINNYANGAYSSAQPDQDIVTEYEYDAAGNTLIVTDTVDGMTRSFYDELNRVAGTIDNWSGSITTIAQLPGCLDLPAGRDDDICTLYAYDELGNTTLVTDTLGRMTRSFYDELNRVEATVQNYTSTLSSPADCYLSADNESEDNICTLYGYDPAGNQITTTNALDQTTLTVYDAANRPFLSVANWDGTAIDEAGDCSFPPAQADVNLCTLTTYDDLGRRASTKSPVGQVTTFAYDGLGRVLTTTRTLAGQPVQTTTTYDALGNRLSQSDPNGHTTAYVYDSLNRLETTTSPEGVTTGQSYDAAGRVITATDGLDQATVNSYDDLGRLVQVTDPLGNSSQYQYDGLGNQLAMIDAEGIKTTYQHDELNRLAGVVENDTGGSQTDDSDVETQYGYDALGNRAVITNALNFTSSLTVYDGLNRPVSVEDALGNEMTTRYNALGSRSVITDANLALTQLAYDGLNRQTSVQFQGDNFTVTTTFDAAGNRLSMTDDLGTTTYQYDDLNRLITVTHAVSGTVVYGYDKAGNRTSLTYPDDKQVTYTYDDDNRLVEVTDWDDGITAYGYDGAGRLITATLPNGVQTSYTYDAANRLTSLVHRDTSGGLLASFLYQLDKVGNRVVVTETLRSPAAGEIAMLPAGATAGELLAEITNGHLAGPYPSLPHTKPLLLTAPPDDTSIDAPAETNAPLAARLFQERLASLQTQGAVAKLTIRLSKTSLTADGRDGTRLAVLATDSNGRPAPDGTLITLSTGGGRLSVAGGHLPAAEAQTVDGLVTAWLEAGDQAGTGFVEASAGRVVASANFELQAPPANEIRLAEAEENPAEPLPFDLAQVAEQARNTFQLQADGRSLVERPNHRALFDGGRLHFTPAVAETRTGSMVSTAAMTVELASVTMGAQTIFAGPELASPQVDGNRLSLARGSFLTEEFIARDGGIEQRWWLNRQPARAGDLTISVEVETALELSPDIGDEGFTFQLVDPETGQATPLAGYGRALALDADGRAKKAILSSETLTPAAGATDEGGPNPVGPNRYLLTMSLPEAWLREASYPLLIDPLIGSLVLVGSGSPSGDQSQPAVTYSSADDQYMVVWQDERGADSDVYGQLIEATGFQLETNFAVITATGDQQSPDVAYNPDDNNYLVAWIDGAEIKGQILDGDGLLSGSVLTITHSSASDPRDPAVTYSAEAGAWLVVWEDDATNDSLLARSVQGDGSMESQFTVEGGASSKQGLDVTANDDGGFLVVWGQDIVSPAGREIMARRVTSTTVTGSPINVTNGGTQGAPAVTYNPDDDEYLLAWDVQDTYDAIWARRVKGITGTSQFAGDAFLVSGSEQADSGKPAVTYYTGGGGAYLVAWEQTVTGGALNLQAQRLTPAGTLSGATLDLSSGSGDQSGVVLGFGPVLSETLAAWSDERGTTADIYGRLVDLDGVLEAEGRLHPESGDQVKPEIAYNPDDDQYLVIWEDYRGGTNADIYGQRVSGVGSLLGDNIAIKTGSGYQQRPHVAYGDGVYLAAWSDSSANAYGRVISPTGELATEDPLQITNASGFQQPTEIVYNEDLSRFLVLWRDRRDGAAGDVWGRHVSADGSMGDEIQVTDTEDQEEFPVGAYNPDDQQYLIVWSQREDSGSDWNIAARRMVISETVVTTETISIAAESYDERYPDVTYLSEANRYVPVWGDYGTAQDIYDRLVKPDGSLDGDINVLTVQKGGGAHIALDGSGGALVTWNFNYLSNINDVFGRAIEEDGDPVGDVQHLVAELDKQLQETLAGDEAGAYFLAWRDERNESWDLYGRPILKLKAGFSATPVSGHVPLQVQFTDGSTPDNVADAWSWGFGDGGSSILQSPVYTYTQAGTYTVTLTITDTESGDTDTITRTNYIEVKSPTVIYYTYDDLYRLTEATYTGGISATYSYDYDAVGNMEVYTETITSTTTVTRTYNAANQLATSNDGSGSTTYTYDDTGNLIQITPPGSIDAVRYGYDQRYLLITNTLYVSGTGWVDQAAYVYDGAGDRVKQVDYTGAQVITTTYTNDIVGLTQVLVAYDDSDQVFNLFGFDLISQDSGSETRTLLADGLGSVRVEMVGDSIDAVTSYSPYGKVLDQEGESGTNYGFTGEQEDGATGLLYLRARYYNVGLHVFMGRDPWSGDIFQPKTLHGFSYVLNSPANYNDPSGFCIPSDDGGDCYHEIPQTTASTRSLHPLIEYVGSWAGAEMSTIDSAAHEVGKAYARVINQNNRFLWKLCVIDSYIMTSPQPAFLSVHGGRVTFKAVSGDPEYLGERTRKGEITVYKEAGKVTGNRMWVLHELGHDFNANAIPANKNIGQPYEDLKSEGIYVEGEEDPIAGNVDGEYFRTFEGFWSNDFPDIQNNFIMTAGEDFADMFSNWVANSFATNKAGDARFRWMERHMSKWIRLAISHNR